MYRYLIALLVCPISSKEFVRKKVDELLAQYVIIYFDEICLTSYSGDDDDNPFSPPPPAVSSKKR